VPEAIGFTWILWRLPAQEEDDMRNFVTARERLQLPPKEVADLDSISASSKQ